jgi:hypothetical protein
MASDVPAGRSGERFPIAVTKLPSLIRFDTPASSARAGGRRELA